MQFAGVKDVVQLHGGLPPSAAFPIAGVSLKLADGSTVDIDQPDLVWHDHAFHVVRLLSPMAHDMTSVCSSSGCPQYRVAAVQRFQLGGIIFELQ